MTDIDEASGIVKIGIKEVDAEHLFQVRLLGEMQKAVDDADRPRALRQLQQLYTYSQAHFASEQVFMRLHSYPGYEKHEREHGELLEEMRIMIESAASPATDLSGWPRTVSRWLISHIKTADAAFATWVRNEEARTGNV